MQGKMVSPETVSTCIEIASREAQKLIAQQQGLAPQQSTTGPYVTTGADLAARQRVFDMAREDVLGILRDSSLQPWELEEQLESAKASLLEKLHGLGFFRFDVR